MLAPTRTFKLGLRSGALVAAACFSVLRTASAETTATIVQVPIVYDLASSRPVEFYTPLRLDAESTVTLTRLEFIVSNAYAADASGTSVTQSETYYHFNPLEQPSSISFTAVAGCQKVGFDIGLPAAINHGDPARWSAGHALNVLECNLHWGWQTGYVFMAIEGKAATSASTSKTFLYHLGTEPMLMRIDLPLPAGVVLSDAEIVFHVERLWNGETRIAPLELNGLTHSAKDDPLAPKIARNIEKAFEIRRRSGR